MLRVFFHKFCARISGLFNEYCNPPEDEELEAVMREYARLGFPGCISSGDGVHIPWDKCPASLQSSHVGKEGVPTIAYNVSVRRRRIQSATRGHAGSRNDR